MTFRDGPDAASHGPDAPGGPHPRRLLLIAGRPSHRRGEHEFRAGLLLLRRCLASVLGLEVEVHAGGWVDDDRRLDVADAIVIYADGDGAHPAVQDDRLDRLGRVLGRGVGFGCLHYAVAVDGESAGRRFLDWLGAHYQNGYSCNPIWRASFEDLPVHPITRGVRPFAIADEWYFNLRFRGDSVPAAREQDEVTPILVATPSDDVRRGPYVHPPGPYPHIVAASGRREILAWAVERGDGGRSFGFTGGHFHANWAQDDFRRLVLNALVWLAGAEVPAGGVRSEVAPGELEQDLDPSPAEDAAA